MAATANEQLILELINRARLDPKGDAAAYITSYTPLVSSDPAIQSALTFFGVNGAALQAAFAALSPAPPLAWNDGLGSAADAHNLLMIGADSQSHQLPGEAGLGDRITTAGYSGLMAAGENIYAFASSPLFGHAGFMVDWGSGPDGMQSPAGHRENIMNPLFREIGIGVEEENNGATQVGPLVITEDFGRRGSSVFVTGVAIADQDRDNFYDIGEGRGGITAAVRSGAASVGSDTTEAAGGYAVAVAPAGTYTIDFSGGGLTRAVSARLSGVTESVKVDLLGANEILSSATTVLGAGAKILGLLGTAAINGTGNTLANVLEGNAGANLLKGLAGSDTLNGGGGRDVLTGGVKRDIFDFNTVSDSGKTAATRDVITDFKHAQRDDIDLRGIDAQTGGGNQAFHFIGRSGFDGSKGALHYRFEGAAKTIVEGDVNGDGRADFQIQLTGHLVLVAGDFLL